MCSASCHEAPAVGPAVPGVDRLVEGTDSKQVNQRVGEYGAVRNRGEGNRIGGWRGREAVGAGH